VRTLCARRENAVCAPWARRLRAVNTLRELLARCENVMDAVKTMWKRCVGAVGTLWGRCVHAITGKFDILGVFRGDPTARWHSFRTLCPYKRCGNAVWCDRGFTYVIKLMKGNPSRSIACTRKQQPRFYWSCSSVVMNDVAPLTPPSAHEQNSIFKCKHHTCTLHDPWRPEKNMTTQWCSTGNFLQPSAHRLSGLNIWAKFHENP